MVRSVFWQTFPDWELLLVGGGSSDNSASFAREMEDRFPGRVRAIRYAGPGTLGIFPSRILGARNARCDTLAHLDSDYEWHPQFLECVFRSS